MTRTLLLLAAVAAAVPLAACARKAPGPPAAAAGSAKASSQGKPAAPVDVDARLLGGTAHVVIRFASPSSGVDISVGGVDGLTVTSATALVQNGTFERGTAAEYNVDYTPGKGRSSLAVTVTGLFGGQPRAKVVTFPIGEPTAEQKASGPAPVQEDGERVKALPAGPGTGARQVR